MLWQFNVFFTSTSNTTPVQLRCHNFGDY